MSSCRLPVPPILVAVSVAVAVAFGSGACANRDPVTMEEGAPTGSTRAATPVTQVKGTLGVFAASSLSEAFTELGQAFEAAHPGVKVTFNFGASSVLAQQVIEGAPADLLATADESNMAKVTDAGQSDDPRIFARNRLSLLVEKGNPKRIRALSDLAEPGVILVLCAPTVPCGRLAAEALAKAGVAVEPKSLEENVKSVASKVALGEADAGIVYVTDAKAAGDEAVAIDIPEEHNVTTLYPLAILREAANLTAAGSFAEFVLTSEGRETLARWGFLAP